MFVVNEGRGNGSDVSDRCAWWVDLRHPDPEGISLPATSVPEPIHELIDALRTTTPRLAALLMRDSVGWSGFAVDIRDQVIGRLRFSHGRYIFDLDLFCSDPDPKEDPLVHNHLSNTAFAVVRGECVMGAGMSAETHELTQTWILPEGVTVSMYDREFHAVSHNRFHPTLLLSVRTRSGREWPLNRTPVVRLTSDETRELRGVILRWLNEESLDRDAVRGILEGDREGNSSHLDGELRRDGVNPGRTPNRPMDSLFVAGS